MDSGDVPGEVKVLTKAEGIIVALTHAIIRIYNFRGGEM